jgi:hypothetical protein
MVGDMDRKELEETEQEIQKIDIVLTILLIIVAISIVFEAGIVIYSFINADKVECNLLWCSFTTEYKHIRTMQCFENNVSVPCDKIKMPEIPGDLYG